MFGATTSPSLRDRLAGSPDEVTSQFNKTQITAKNPSDLGNKSP